MQLGNIHRPLYRVLPFSLKARNLITQ